eukprot:gene1749-1910_t
MTLHLYLSVLFIYLLCLWQRVDSDHHPSRNHHHNHHSSVEGYNLPVLTDTIQQHVQPLINQKDPITGKYIPRTAWIAVRNKSEERAIHMTAPDGFLARNPTWQIHFCGNEEKDEFMNTVYQNTSLLWAYHILNPLIGTAKAELWRLAILYYHGGLYMDDDATFTTPLDKIVTLEDKFIVGKEGYSFTDHCYIDEYPLSNASLTKRFGEANSVTIFDNRYFFNWALFSMPGHPLLKHILEHVVELIKHEYFRDSRIKMAPRDVPGKILMCASTFPITLVAREMILEGHSMAELGLRVGGELFREYGANMKAWNNDHNPNRWVKVMNKRRVPYLWAYAPPRPEYYEGKIIQGNRHREIALVSNGKRHPFPDLDTFLNMKLTIENVTIVDMDVIHAIPLGDPLPVLKG